VGHQCPSVSVISGTADHRLIGSPLRSPWRIERSSVMAAESIRRSAELSGSSGMSGVLGGDSRSRTQRGWLMGSQGMVREGARGWITCDLSGTRLELVSHGTSGEAAGRLVEEKVGVTAGIVTKQARRARDQQLLVDDPWVQHLGLNLSSNLCTKRTPLTRSEVRMRVAFVRWVC